MAKKSSGKDFDTIPRCPIFEKSFFQIRNIDLKEKKSRKYGFRKFF